MTYQIKSLLFFDSLTDEDIQRHNCSDRIWLPRTDFERHMSRQEAGALLVLKLINGVEQSVVGTPFGYHHDGPNQIYVPQWMLETLEYDAETIRIEPCTPSLCSRISIVPFTSEHLVAEDPQIYFRDGFEAYTCIQRGLILPLFCNGISVSVSVSDAIPNTDEPLCIRDVELELELERPLDRPETPPLPLPLPLPILDPSSLLQPPPSATNDVVEQPSRDEVRRRCLAAALLRANKC
jgi:hypothetical protein